MVLYLSLLEIKKTLGHSYKKAKLGGEHSYTVSEGKLSPRTNEKKLAFC